MTYITTAKNIRFNQRDVILAKIDGVIVYEKINYEDLYIEYQVIDCDQFLADSLPVFYLNDGTCIEYGTDHKRYNDFFEKIEITLKDGSIVNRITLFYCNEISNIKLWYPKSVARIQFEAVDQYHYPMIESINYCYTRFLNNMAEMFSYCRDTTSLNLSSFDTYRVMDMNFMFSNCRSLINLNLSNFDTSRVMKMNGMFNCCDKLIRIKDIESFDTSNVTTMKQMFYSCNSLTQLNLSNWRTSKVTDMSFMFLDCDALTTLNLSNFDTSNVTTMENMFSSCSNLEELDLSNFDITNKTSVLNMFDYCNKLHTLRLDNCSYDTISKIININSSDLPTGDIYDSEGNPIPRKIYCRQANAAGLTAPNGWSFEFID
jgi:surface protein